MASGIAGPSSQGVGPREKANSRTEYFKMVQKDLNKRFNKNNTKKKTAPAKEK